MFLHHQGDSQRLICQKRGMSCHGVQCFEETKEEVAVLENDLQQMNRIWK